MTGPEASLVNQCRLAAEAANAFLAVVGQRDSRKSGSTLGFPDLVLMRYGQIRLIECKRPKADGDGGGHLNLGQHAFIAMALEHGVEVEVIDNLNDFVRVLNGCCGGARVRAAR